MNFGILIYAHNNEQIDYVKMATVSAKLAKKYLNVPVSLVTDSHSMDYVNTTSHAEVVKETFDNIIINDNGYNNNNRRIMSNGEGFAQIPFFNGDRLTAFDLTPYDRTLIIDSDYLVLSNSFKNYWRYTQSFLMAKNSIDISGNRLGPKDYRISETGLVMNYATTIMFTKNKESQTIFNLAKEIKNKYTQYANLYRFDPKVFRNDIVFTIANHVVSGFSTDNTVFLPDVRCFLDSDQIVEITDDGKIKVLVNQTNNSNGYFLSSVKDVDLHFMNKQTINDNFDKFLKVFE